MEKHLLRRALLERRTHLDAKTRQGLSALAQQRLIASACFGNARCLLLYSPIRNEVETGQLFLAARQLGKRVCYPRVRQQSLEYVAVNDLAELSPGAYGVAEPLGGEILSPQELDLVVVPGVAFDRSGMRLGYGKGFYDRELARLAATTSTVGLCYEFQLCPALPRDPHDVPVRYLATEQQFIPCHIGVTGSP